jgi:hypothetical protein
VSNNIAREAPWERVAEEMPGMEVVKECSHWMGGDVTYFCGWPVLHEGAFISNPNISDYFVLTLGMMLIWFHHRNCNDQ